ncbi:MAG: alpha/beta hydrolase [Myxococcales bacterium FL481]|nr:MAG: alpha/beta hydrolase [Myxococcales bacterium FL481]
MFAERISDMMIKPGSSPVFGTPKDYGLEYEDVRFQASDGVELSGWIVKGGNRGIIVQSHFGVQSSRTGFTPEGKGMIKLWKTDIPFLRHVKALVEAGYSVLMYDFRNHGESGGGTCPWVSWGPEEHKDVLAAIDFLTRHESYRNSPVGLLSICMGAAATTYAYGNDEALRRNPNIKALIAVQPLLYPDFVHGLGIPGFLSRGASKVNLERTGIDLDKASFMPHVKHIPVPTLVVQNKNDPWANVEAVQHYYDELQVDKDLRWLDLSRDRAAAYHYLGESPEMIVDFFGKHI